MLQQFKPSLKTVAIGLAFALSAFGAIQVGAGLTNANLGQPYNFQLTASGGVSPYTYTVSSGTLPSGLSLSSAGVISGIPQVAGQYSFGVQAADAASATGTTNLTLRVNSTSGLAITNAAIPVGRIGAPYDITLAASGGASPYSWDLVLGGGALPPGLSFSSAGRISGTPTSAGVFPLLVRVTDANGNSFQSALSVTIEAASLMISTTSLAGASANVPYSQTVVASGGTPPYAYSLLSGNLPPGLSIATDGAITGTPTSAGTYNFFIRTTDAANSSAQASFAIVVSASAPRIVISSLPNGIVNQAFNGALVAQGGTAPYSFTLLSGTLPAGLTLSSSGAITGIAASTGAFPITVRLTDASGQTAQSDILLIVNTSAFNISTASLANAFVNTPYQSPLLTTGGSAPIVYSLLSGNLPLGVVLTGNGSLSGTPTTAGSYTFVVRAVDALGAQAQTQLTLLVQASSLSISQAGFANGQVGQAYSSTLTASSGAAPYTFSLLSGSLPAGLTLASNGNLSGTPTTGGLYLATIRVVDSNQAASQITVPIFVNSTGLRLTTLNLPSARQNQAFSTSLQASGGTTPYTYSLATGSTLPEGLALSPSGLLSGTPTQATGSPFTVIVTDNTGATSQATYYFNINSASFALAAPSIANGQLGRAYTYTYSISGASGAVTYRIEAGTLPTGLILNTNGTLTGTPTAAGTYLFQLRATDAANQSAIFSQAIAITSADLAFMIPQIPSFVVGTPYFATFGGMGGTPPYTYSVASGNLPPGLTLGSNGSITGTPTVSGSYSAIIRITDAAGATATVTANFSTAITSGFSIATAALPSARRGQQYTGEVVAAGGRPPYFFALAPGSSLPAGLTLAETGQITGTPTADGSSTFVIRVQDGNAEVAQRTLALTVLSSTTTLDIVNSTLPNGIIGSPYSVILSPTGGVPIYTFTLASGTLPPGLTLSGSGVISGTPTTANSYPIVVRLGDANGIEVQKAYTILVGSSALAFTNLTLPTSFLAQSYRATLQAAGGVAPYRFAIQNGNLPAGLILDENGVIRGTPTASGQTSVTFRVTDATGATAINTLNLGVTQSPIGFGFTTLSGATIGQAYNFTPSATGGTAPYTYTVVSGLPAGITLGSNGSFTGVPTQEGTFFLTLRVRDANGAIVESTFPLTVAQPGFRIANATLATANLNQSYTQALTTTGGVGAVSFALQSGSLPPGLSLAPNGTFTGIATTAGAYTFVIRATDSAGGSTTATYTLTVTAPVVNFTTAFLPSGTINQAYNQTIALQGGTAPYSFILNSGTLPPGLTLNNSGVINGTPTAIGTYPFSLRAVDSLGQTNTTDFLIGISAVGAPNIAAVVNSANYTGNGIVPGEIVVVFGTNLGPATLTSFTVTNNTVGTSLSGTRILFDDVPAPVIYTSANQIAAVVPFSVAGKTSVRIVVENAGSPAAAILLPVRASKPALFTINSSGTGSAAVLNQDGTVNSVSNPAPRQSIISLFATGLGQTNPASQDGRVVNTTANLLATVTATVNAQAAQVEYAGNAPGLVPGVAQLNVRLPANAISGSNSVQITSGSVSSSSSVTVFIQ